MVKNIVKYPYSGYALKIIWAQSAAFLGQLRYFSTVFFKESREDISEPKK